MATEVISTIRATGGDYTSLTAWEAGQQALHNDLVLEDINLVAEVYNDWPTGMLERLYLNGFVTDATHKLIIRPAVGHGHTGDKNTGFLLKSSTTNGAVLPYVDVVVKGIRICDSISNSRLVRHVTLPFGKSLTLDSCVIYSEHTGSNVANELSPGSIIYSNCLMLNFHRSINMLQAAPLTELHNCTVVDSIDRGVLRCVVKNTVVVGSTVTDFYEPGVGSVNYASSDSTGLITGVSTVAGVDFINPAADDYNVVPGGALENSGADLSTSFTNDIVGNTRTLPFDIGAFESIPQAFSSLIRKGASTVSKAYVGATEILKIYKGDTRIL